MLELARESDWEAVRRLSIQIHDMHAAWRPDMYFHSDEPYPKEQFLADIRSRLVYTAKVYGVVAGYVIVSLLEKGGPGTVEQRLMRLDVLCVDEAARGQGIGRAMVDDVRALARAFGCRGLILSAHPENEAALAFYRACGFQLRTVQLEQRIVTNRSQK